jgi:hypothetical protein
MSAQHAPHGPVPPAAVAMGLATAYQASQAVVVAATLGISDVLSLGLAAQYRKVHRKVHFSSQRAVLREPPPMSLLGV